MQDVKVQCAKSLVGCSTGIESILGGMNTALLLKWRIRGQFASELGILPLKGTGSYLTIHFPVSRFCERRKILTGGYFFELL